MNYRPKKFQEVIGQEIPILLIENAIKNNKLPNVIAIYGESGIGKTTLARLIAAFFVCENIQNNDVCGKCNMCLSIQECTMPDVLEFDAASYTSVDDIRLIIEQCNYLPQFSKKKIFIIDEAHMLSRNAAAALLKTFEETLDHVIFILATTDIDKLSNAIKSRCFCLPLKSISINETVDYLTKISQNEKIEISQNSANLIAKLSNGSLRESLSIFNRAKLLTNCITDEVLHKILFFAKNEDIAKLCGFILEKKSLETYEFSYYLLTNFNISSFSLLQQILFFFQNLYNIDEKKQEILKIMINLNKLNNSINKQHIFIEKIILGLASIAYEI